MPVTTLLDLRDWILECGLIAPSRHVTIEEQLVMFLWMVGHGTTNREAQEQFQHSGDTISR
jgi:hypothetical protein